MVSAARSRLVGVVALVLAGLFARSFPTGLGFAAVFAVVYGVGAWLFVRRWGLWSTGNLWSGLLAGLVTFAAVTGVQTLPIDSDVAFPVGLLVIGLGFTCATIGAEFALSSANGEREQTVTGLQSD